MELQPKRDDFRPKKRSAARLLAGKAYYTLKRYLLWLRLESRFAKRCGELEPSFTHFEHQSPLVRDMKGDSLKYQRGKVKNIALAAPRLDGLLLRPGEILSYWRLIGRPSARRGFREGMVLNGGVVSGGTGGGLCALSNLIYWMTLHTPLTVIERYRHGYDVFPDAQRTQPFGSGATCSYPYLDLMIRNDTALTFRLSIFVDGEFLRGSWSADAPPVCDYEIVERSHEMRGEPFGGFSRHNELWRISRGPGGGIICEEKLAENHAMMMYSPLLSDINNIEKSQGGERK